MRVQVERALDDTTRIEMPPDACPPLVDGDTFAAVQARLGLNQAEATRRNKDPELALLRGGYIVCGYCGAPMHAYRATGGRAAQYMCGRRRNGYAATCKAKTISVHLVDAAVWQHITDRLRDPKTVAKMREQRQATGEAYMDRHRATLRSVEGRMAELKKEVANLAQAIAEASTIEARAALTRALDDLTPQQRTLEAERAEARAAVERQADNAAEFQTFIGLAQAVAGRLATFTYAQKRLTLHALGVRVQVWGRDHKPRCRINWDFGGFNTGIDLTPLDFDEGELLALEGAASSSVSDHANWSTRTR